MSRVWALIPCTILKAGRPCPARELYWASPLFRGAWLVAESRGYQPLILSAKHGVVWPQQVLEPYDETLAGRPRYDRYAWAMRVLHRLTEIVSPQHDSVVSFLGQTYAEFLVPAMRDLGWRVEEPLRGLRVGERLRWFHQQLGTR